MPAPHLQGSSSCGWGGCLLGEDFADAADLGSYCAQLFFDVFVATVDVIDAIDDGFSVGDQCGEDKRGRGAQVGGEYGGGAQRSLAANYRAASFNFYVRTHAHQFLSVHETVLEDVFGDDRGTVRLCR